MNFTPKGRSVRASVGSMAFDRQRAREAARHPDRGGENCGSGEYVPWVNRNKCEGKQDCVRVCPYNVFEVRTIAKADFSALSVFGKLRNLAHGKQTAYTPRAEACHACGLCVVACPEQAITLTRRDAAVQP